MPQLRTLLCIGLFALCGLLAGCQGGAVVFAPTPLPPDLSPLRYTHPSGAFSLNVPRNWARFEQSTTQLAAAAFSPPGSTESSLRVGLINLGDPIAPGDLGELMNAYQTLHRPDLADYREQARQAMGDGSWRLAGVRALANGGVQQINTFIQAAGTLLAVTEVIIPSDAVTFAELQTAVNTLQFDQTTAGTALAPSGLATLGFARATALDVRNVSSWTTPGGVFFVTGEIANYTSAATAPVAVQVALLDAGGAVIDAASDLTMGYAVAAGGLMPFSLRFGGGQPPNAVDYVVQIDAPALNAPDRPVVGREALSWEDQSTFATDGALVITATVTNTDDAPLRAPVATATVFDATGRVIGARFVALEATLLAPGESAAVEFRIDELGSEPVNYIVEFQALR